MLQVQVFSNNPISTIYLTKGNKVSLKVISDSLPTVSINSVPLNFTLESGIYKLEYNIINNTPEGNFDIRILNDEEEFNNSDLIVSKTPTEISYQITTDVSKIIGDKIYIDLQTTKKLFSYPKISFSSIKNFSYENFEEIKKEEVIWTKTNDFNWVGEFIFSDNIVLDSFTISCCDEAGNITLVEEASSNIKNLLETKVDKILGKGLSSNDFTDELLDKINNFGENYIESISVNNVPQTVIDKSVNIQIPEGTFSTNIKVSLSNGKTLGRYLNGSTIPAQGKTFQEVFLDIAQEIQNPTLIAPTFSFSGNQGSFREIGENANILMTFTFNRGSIVGNISGEVWDANLFQNFRAGLPIASNPYRFWNDLLNNYTFSNNNQQNKIVLVVLGTNTIKGTVEYQQGVQPLNSLSQNFSTPLSASVSPIQIFTFEGVYPIFGTTVSINSATKQALVSMSNGNNIPLSLVAETSGQKQKFWLPTFWQQNRPLIGIEYFNTLTGQWDTTNRISEWTSTDDFMTIQGNVIDYKRFTFNGLNRGSILIRLKF